MCGRFVQTTRPEVLAELFDITVTDLSVDDLSPRYNIAPSASVAVIEADGTARCLVTRRWGLVPRWAKDPSIAARLSNARSETAWDRPSFRDSMRHGRCLVPIDGFYEWAPATPDGPRTASGRPAKRPHLFRSASNAPLLLAGIGADWSGPDHGGALRTVCLLTTSANELMAPIHDRMPVIIDREMAEVWLHAAPGEARDLLDHLLQPASVATLTEYEVGVEVNDARNESPELITAVTDHPPTTLF